MRIALMSLLMIPLAVGCGDDGDKSGDDTGRSADADTDSDSVDSGDTGQSWPEDLIILDNVRVVDAAQITEDAAVLLVGDLIWDVMDAGQVWPITATVQDLTGYTVIPGLIDSHTHIFHSGSTWWVGETLRENLVAQLAWGVTGVVDLGAPEEVFTLRDRIDDGTLLGPRIWATGPFLTAIGSHPCETIHDDTLCRYVDGDATEHVAALSSADGIKVAVADASFTPWPTERIDLGDLADIVDAASAVDQPVWAHIDEPEDAEDALNAGASFLAHPVFSEIVSETTDLPFSSTVSTFANPPALVSGDLLDEPLEHTPEAVVLAWIWLNQNPDAFLDGWIEASAEWSTNAVANIQTAITEERTVLAGSDAGYWFVPHGLGLHQELAWLVEAGMSPQQAIGAATAEPAQILGWDDLGWISAGYRANLVVIDGNPDEDIAASREVVSVFVDGQQLDPETLSTDDLWLGGSTETPAENDFCLTNDDCCESDDDDACTLQCDLVDHRCVESCTPTYDLAGSCDEDSWCMPADGLASTDEGACHPGDGCSLYSQDCQPTEYGDNCTPSDVDTTSCWPSGEQQEFETCSWTDPDLYCAQGLFCSWITNICYTLCDPDEDHDTCPTASTSCTQQYAEDETGSCTHPSDPDCIPWFGLCL